MKRIFLAICTLGLLASCNQTKQKSETSTDSLAHADTIVPTTNSNNNANAFDINTLPVSKADIGTFPFFTLPKGLETQNKPLEKKFDVCYFPINGSMIAKEGRLWKANITAVQGEEFSQRYFEKSVEDYLLSLGATKIFDGSITQEEYDKYNKQDPNKGNEGDIGYPDQNIKVYAIRTPDKGNVYIQLTANNASGKLNILQEEALTQTITKITADKIAKDIAATGKAILYINFDVDKSSLTNDGKEVVDEIAKALKSDDKIKISVEGHTDNTGDAKHNQQLSLDRANAVVSKLESDGIIKSRLSAKGFGADKPLVANDSEQNKAKNRRVELVKL